MLQRQDAFKHAADRRRQDCVIEEGVVQLLERDLAAGIRFREADHQVSHQCHRVVVDFDGHHADAGFEVAYVDRRDIDHHIAGCEHDFRVKTCRGIKVDGHSDLQR